MQPHPPQPGTIAVGDNLAAMRDMPDSCIDLIYADPPYNSGVDYQSKTGAFKDKWSAADIRDDDTARIAAAPPALAKAVEFAAAAGDVPMQAYLAFMAVRLLEMHRILKDTGSLYLHADATAAHYLKLLLDAVFGRANFRREIVWATCDNSGFKGAANNWIRGADTLLYYAKSKQFAFNKQHAPRQAQSLKGYSKTDENGERYKRYRNPDGSERRVYLNQAGVPLPSVWTDIPSFQTAANAPEITGYPTQKPEKLLERIIAASSNEGDLVFDPFLGAGTTAVAAGRLNRRWCGCDLNSESAALTERRLAAERRPELPESIWKPKYSA